MSLDGTLPTDERKRIPFSAVQGRVRYKKAWGKYALNVYSHKKRTFFFRRFFYLCWKNKNKKRRKNNKKRLW